jgi:predicted nucleic acid-binding protein
VPALCDIEVVAGLRRAILRGLLTDERAQTALAQYLRLPLARHGHSALLSSVLALRSNFGAYDACYVALAERLGAEFLTADSRLVRATREHTRVVVIAADQVGLR